MGNTLGLFGDVIFVWSPFDSWPEEVLIFGMRDNDNCMKAPRPLQCHDYIHLFDKIRMKRCMHFIKKVLQKQRQLLKNVKASFKMHI